MARQPSPLRASLIIQNASRIGKRLTLITFFAAALIILSGCVNPMNYQKDVENFFAVGGQYLLHENLRPGDFARYKVTGSITYPQSNKTYYFEKDRLVWIVKIENGEVYIREDEKVLWARDAATDTLVAPHHAAILCVPRRIVADMNGNIRKAYQLMNHKFNPMPISQPGGMGYISWTALEERVPITTAPGKTVTTRPMWYRKTSSLNFRAAFTAVNAESTTVEICYVNDAVKFRSVLNQSLTLSSVGTSVSWTQIALILVQSMSYTNFFTSPATLSRDFAKKGFVDFAKSSVIPSKKQALTTLLEKIDIRQTATAGGKTDWVYYLVGDGNLETEKARPSYYYGYPEPEGFQ